MEHYSHAHYPPPGQAYGQNPDAGNHEHLMPFNGMQPVYLPHPGHTNGAQPPMMPFHAPQIPASVPSTALQERRMEYTSSRDGLRYVLKVMQQPQRARMCGFGDKDRRPITPPPCVRLVIYNDSTNEEISADELKSDPAFFVLQVDLWAEHADREANVVRASATSPAVSISSATTTSYPPPSDRPIVDQRLYAMMQHTPGHPVYVPGYGMPMAAGAQFAAPSYLTGHGMSDPNMTAIGYAQPISGPAAVYAAPIPSASNNAMYTRNLIGSLTVNASRLKDTDGKVGYWFVLQDLSVRTEGLFRLRMSFIDISAPNSQPGLNRGKAAILAWVFSDVFQVYSAKKFPGVIESTALSKTFASQGIKIPIRKDNKGDGGDDDDLGD